MTTDTTSTTHTPGPWQTYHVGDLEGAPVSVFAFHSNDDRSSQHIADVWGHTLDREEAAEANARLIAASPDLLAALRDVQQCLDRSTFRGLLVTVDAAIARATGGEG